MATPIFLFGFRWLLQRSTFGHGPNLAQKPPYLVGTTLKLRTLKLRTLKLRTLKLRTGAYRFLNKRKGEYSYLTHLTYEL